MAVNPDVSLRTGMVSGTLLSILPDIGSADVFRTVVLAAIGAIASYLVTVLLKRISFPKRKR